MPHDDEGLPNVAPALFDRPTGARFAGAGTSTHAPRFLLLYGSLRERSYSKLLTLEAARRLRAMGEVRIFDPAGLPLLDDAPESHPKVQELRDAATWAEGMVWTSPERHGAMTGIMKVQIRRASSTSHRWNAWCRRVGQSGTCCWAPTPWVTDRG